MSGNYRNYGNDPQDKQRQILDKGQSSLNQQEESLMNTVGLLKETNQMMNEGVVAIKEQGDNLGQAHDKTDNVAHEIKKAGSHAKEISKRDKCTKCLLVVLSMMLLVAIIVVLIYKIKKWTS
jgi:hypothetical protein